MSIKETLESAKKDDWLRLTIEARIGRIYDDGSIELRAGVNRTFVIFPDSKEIKAASIIDKPLQPGDSVIILSAKDSDLIYTIKTIIENTAWICCTTLGISDQLISLDNLVRYTE